MEYKDHQEGHGDTIFDLGQGSAKLPNIIPSSLFPSLPSPFLPASSFSHLSLPCSEGPSYEERAAQRRAEREQRRREREALATAK